MSDPTKNSPSADTLAAAIKQVAEQLIPAAIVAAVQATKAQNQPVAPQRLAPVAPQRCHECGQQKTACEGKHLKMVVFPMRYPQHAEYFQGVFLNGVRYLSNDGSHEVTVPAIAEATIRNIVSGFETDEQARAVGRKAERHSGVVTPSGAATTQATQGWR